MAQYDNPNKPFILDLTARPEDKPKTANKLPDTPIDITKPEEPKADTPKVNAGNGFGQNMSQEVQAFDPTTLIPKKEIKDEGANELFNALDLAVEREKQEITARHEELAEKMFEEHLNAEDNEEITTEAPSNNSYSQPERYTTEAEEEDEEVETSTDSESYESNNRYVTFDKEDPVDPADPAEPIEDKKVATIVRKVSDSTEDIYEDTSDDEEEDEAAAQKKAAEDEQKEVDDIIEGLKSAAKATLKPSHNKIDLEKFKVSKKGVNVTKVIYNDIDRGDVADWVLYGSKVPIAMRGLTGPELIKLDPENSNRSRQNFLKDAYRIIYDKVVDANKPDFITWMKQTKYTDVDNIYFGLYMATFNGSNFVSYQCPDCKKVFIKEVNFRDMVKFKDDTVRAKVEELMTHSTDNGEIPYEVERIQVSDKYVFDMKSPSLYNVVYETAGLSQTTLDKYGDLIDTITFIDAVYTIDYTNMQLVPVMIPTVKDNLEKTIANRIKFMYNILRQLSSDEYYAVRGYITKITDQSADISYLIPGAKCPECDKEIPANEETDGQAMLFTRHHLGAFANM